MDTINNAVIFYKFKCYQKNGLFCKITRNKEDRQLVVRLLS
jgi:hypothetical protein